MLFTRGTWAFCAGHPETLFRYDPVLHKSQEIYPQKNDPFRKTFSERLEKVLNQKRCQENDWLYDPDDFGSVVDPIEVNDETLSLALRVEFDTEGFLPHEEAEDSGKWDDDQYAYIYRPDPRRWREFSVYDLKPKFGTDSLKDLLAETAPSVCNFSSPVTDVHLSGLPPTYLPLLPGRCRLPVPLYVDPLLGSQRAYPSA